MAEADQPDVVIGFRLQRADAFIRLAYARGYRLALRVFFGLPARDPDCACKLFRRSRWPGIGLESGGAFMSAELLIKLRQSGRQIAQAGVPHYPRTAGSASGAKPARRTARGARLLEPAPATVGQSPASVVARRPVLSD